MVESGVTLLARLYTVKMKVFTAHHFVPIHTLFLFLVCVLGQFSVQYTLSFLQCNGSHAKDYSYTGMAIRDNS